MRKTKKGLINFHIFGKNGVLDMFVSTDLNGSPVSNSWGRDIVQRKVRGLRVFRRGTGPPYLP